LCEWDGEWALSFKDSNFEVKRFSNFQSCYKWNNYLE